MTKDLYDRKLPLRVRIGYPLTNVGSTLQTLIQMYFLLTFYVSFLGISGTAAGIIIMIARIWDFINDPIMGMIVEKVKRPEKCLFIMRCALVPIAIFMVLCYTAPDISYSMKVVWAFVTFVCLGMSQTAYSISKDTLQPRLTTNRLERSKLNTYNQVFSTILNAVVPAVTMPLVGYLAGYGEASAFAKVSAIYAVVYVLTGLAGTYMCRGFDSSEDDAQVQKGNAVKIKDMLKALALNKVAVLLIVIQVMKMLLSSIAGSILLYFCTYNLGNANAMSLATSLSTIGGIIPIFFLVPLHKKFGNAGSGLLGCVVIVATYLAMFVTGVPSVSFFVAMNIIGTIGTTLLSAVMIQILMDSVDYGEWRTGHKNTGVIMSANGIGNKIGLAFGSSLAGFVLGFVNFDPNAAVQPQHILNVFFHLTVTAQLVIYVLIMVVLLFIYRLEKKLPQMKEEVAQRKLANS